MTARTLMTLRTPLRLVLTGYPLQNNLYEYWCIMDFVAPNCRRRRVSFAFCLRSPSRQRFGDAPQAQPTTAGAGP